MSELQYFCPQCNSPNHLQFVATVWVDLVQNTLEFHTEAANNEHEYTIHSAARCMKCYWVGVVDSCQQ